MIGSGPLGGFRVPARTVLEIRQAANSIREFLDIGDAPQEINFEFLLEKLSVDYSVTYDVMEKDDMPASNIEACCDPEKMAIYIRRDVFEKLCKKDARSNFTIMHELGHLLLGHRRTINRSSYGSSEIQRYEDSEWQANQFAAEVLMPLNVIKAKQLNTATKIEKYFKVSFQAASLRQKQLKKRGELPMLENKNLSAPTLR